MKYNVDLKRYKNVMNIKKYDIVRCIMYDCDKVWFLRKKQDATGHSSLPVGIRPKNCITCGTKCSKKYSKLTTKQRAVVKAFYIKFNNSFKFTPK